MRDAHTDQSPILLFVACGKTPNVMQTTKQILAGDDLLPSISKIGTSRLPCVGLILVQLRAQFRSTGRSSRASTFRHATIASTLNPLMKLRTLTAFILLGTLACFHANFATCLAATHTWTGASGDGKWSTAFNWSGSSAPVANEAASVVLVFPPAGSKHTTNNIANLTVDQIQITGDNYFIATTGAGTDVTLRSQVFGSSFFITGANAVLTNFTFTIATNIVNDGSIAVGTGETATFRSRFTGPGNLVKRANGTVVLRGGAARTPTRDRRALKAACCDSIKPAMRFLAN